MRAELGRRWGGLRERFPALRWASALGWKYVLVEALIEVPFLLIELSLWLGPLAGITFGLSLWQRALLAALIYALVEGARFVVVALVRRQPYRVLGAEREAAAAAWRWLSSRRGRRGGSVWTG